MARSSLILITVGLACAGASSVAGGAGSTPVKPGLARPAILPAIQPGGRAERPVTRAELVRDLDLKYKALDINNDGDVTQAEIRAAQARAEQAVDAQLAKRRAADFARLDTDRDGRLTSAEYSAGTPIAPRRKADPDAVVLRMDIDKNRAVSAAEFRAPSLATFDKLDVNGDGIAAIDEQRKARRAGR